MSLFPYTHLFLASEKALVVSGYHYHVLDAKDGRLLHSTTQLGHDFQASILASGPIRCIAVDLSFTHVATIADNKILKIWNVTDTPKLVNERELPKKPTEIAFTRDGQTIVISDKFGDVFSYPLHPEPTSELLAPSSGVSKRGSVTAHENPSNGTLILGHASLLTTFLLTPDERYVVTADRDEHIRVSWYPQGYNIERYCLGHEKYVSALHIPSFKETLLVSGGGDPMLKIWDYMSGRLLANIPVLEFAEPYIKVRAPKRKHGYDEDDGETEEGARPQKGKGRRGRKGKRKESVESEKTPGNQIQEQGKDGQSITVADLSEPVDGRNWPTVSEETVLVFIVHKIQSVDRGEHGQFIVFSVVGASALFYTPLPKESASGPSPVLAFEFPVPILDFTVCPDGAICTLLDAEWAGVESLLTKPQFVTMLFWNGNTLSESRSVLPLTNSLNTNCLVPATLEDLKKLDLYSDLSSLPKNVDPEHDPLIRDTLSKAAAFDLTAADGTNLTPRELGRLKKQKALLAKIQERDIVTKRASRDCSETRDIKKAKSESDSGKMDDDNVGGEDGSDGSALIERQDDVQDVVMDAS